MNFKTPIKQDSNKIKTLTDYLLSASLLFMEFIVQSFQNFNVCFIPIGMNILPFLTAALIVI
jgi:hypothetical protein